MTDKVDDSVLLLVWQATRGFVVCLTRGFTKNPVLHIVDLHCAKPHKCQTEMSDMPVVGESIKW
jgi:hypothetical protein